MNVQSPDSAAPVSYGFTVRSARCVVPRTAVILTDLLLVTAYVVTVKLAVVEPDGTVMLAGTLAADVLLLESVTTAPAAGATLSRVTVPVEEVPPRTVPGFKEIELSTAVVTVRVAVRVVPR